MRIDVGFSSGIGTSGGRVHRQFRAGVSVISERFTANSKCKCIAALRGQVDVSRIDFDRALEGRNNESIELGLHRCLEI